MLFKHIGYFDLDWSNRHVVCTRIHAQWVANGYCRFMKFSWQAQLSGSVWSDPVRLRTWHVESAYSQFAGMSGNERRQSNSKSSGSWLSASLSSPKQWKHTIVLSSIKAESDLCRFLKKDFMNYSPVIVQNFVMTKRRLERKAEPPDRHFLMFSK